MSMKNYPDVAFIGDDVYFKAEFVLNTQASKEKMALLWAEAGFDRMIYISLKDCIDKKFDFAKSTFYIISPNMDDMAIIGDACELAKFLATSLLFLD